MKLLFIGTGSGLTSEDRFHSSIMVKHADKELLIDVGDGFSKAFINQKLSFTENIDFIFITHFHPDHLSGLPTLLLQMKLRKRAKSLKILVHKDLKQTLTNILSSFYVYINKLEFQVEIIPYTESLIELAKDFSIEIKKNEHIKQKPGIIVYEKLGFQSVSIKINCGTQKVVFTSDIGCKNDLYLFNESQSNYFISELTHINSEELVEALDSLKTDKIILTHLDAKSLKEIFDNKLIMQKISAGKVFIAFDGMEIAE